MEVLSVRNINKTFGTHHVLKDVSLSVQEGEVVAVIGRSGGGKTTTLRCITSLETPDTGSITVCGKAIFDAKSRPSAAEIREARAQIGLVFQNFNLFPQYNVLNNVLLAAKVRFPERDGQELHDDAKSILCRMGLADKLLAYPSQLSGGQQQRVAIARALMLNPTLLCFDEPTSALDPELTGEVVKVIKDLRDQGHTMVIVTHEMEFARQVADRVIFFADGRVEEEGPPEALFTQPHSEKLKAFLQA